MIRQALVLSFAFAAGPALSDDLTGDASKGERAFRACVACHVVKDPDGNTLAGRSGRAGPNLYGIVGRTAGGYEGFRYSEGIVAAGEAGLVWNEETFVAYVQDPTKYIRELTGDTSARSKMTYRVRKPEDAADLYAYLVSLNPVSETSETEEAAEPDTTQETQEAETTE